MHTIFVLVRKDFDLFCRSRSAIALTFLVPFGMIYLFGQIFGLNRQDRGPSGIPLALVNTSTHPAAADLVASLHAEKSFRLITEFTRPDQSKRSLQEDDLRPLMQAPGAPFRFAFILSPDQGPAGANGVAFKILSNPRNEIETQTVTGLLQKTIFSRAPQLLGASLQTSAQRHLGPAAFNHFNRTVAAAVAEAYGGDPVTIADHLVAGDFFATGLFTPPAAAGAASQATRASVSPAVSPLEQLLKIETVQVVGAQVKSPQATAVVGGWAMQFLLFALSASATSLFHERDAGLLQRLFAGSVTRSHLLWSKFCFGTLLGLGQLLVLFFAGSLLFGLAVVPHLVLLGLVCLFSAAACTSFGMLVASVAPNAEAASGLATFLILTMSALGGAWFPVSLMPTFIQSFSQFTLVYWSMEGFSAVLWADQSFLQILPILGILAGHTTLVMLLALACYQRSKIFR